MKVRKIITATLIAAGVTAVYLSIKHKEVIVSILGDQKRPMDVIDGDYTIVSEE